MNFFSEHQKGATKWDHLQLRVEENRTEILDASRRIIRDGMVVLPRQTPIVEEFASHMAAIAKRLEVDETTGDQRYAYVRSGPDHYSMAFTYDCVAAEQAAYSEQPFVVFL